MKTNDYKNYDTLTLYVKKEKQQEIAQYYFSFGWELAVQGENKRYEDINDFTFVRLHKIKNKDELQLLQVYMEEDINQLAKLDKQKYAKSTALGLCLGIFGFLSMSLGLLFFLNFLPQSLLGGLIFSVLGIGLIVLMIVLLPRLIKKEKEIYSQKYKILDKNLHNTIEKAKLLVGEKYE